MGGPAKRIDFLFSHYLHSPTETQTIQLHYNALRTEINSLPQQLTNGARRRPVPDTRTHYDREHPFTHHPRILLTIHNPLPPLGT